MRINRLAEIFSLKYKVAADPVHMEMLLRNEIDSLHKNLDLFNILRKAAESGAAKPKNPLERRAVAAYAFLKDLVSMIDYLKINKRQLDLGQIREMLLKIVNLISANKEVKFNNAGVADENGELSNVQFAHVSDLIMLMIPATTVGDRKKRDDQYQKARTGLSRILSTSITMLDQLSKLEVMVPEKFTHVSSEDIEAPVPERFEPQRGMLSVYDIVDFIRQHGDKYGISSRDDWSQAITNDPELKEQMTTVINALNRGHSPRDGAAVKAQIAEILNHHRERMQTNKSVFNKGEEAAQRMMRAKPVEELTNNENPGQDKLLAKYNNLSYNAWIKGSFK